MTAFIANENFPQASIRLLQLKGHQVLSINEQMKGATDHEVMEMAMQTRQTILTHDKDYGELVFRYGLKPPGGVIFFRIVHFQPEQPASLLLDLMQSHALKLEGYFTVIEQNQVRQIPIV